ncbi:MAG: PilZ domain-containing protein [Acidiferrobacterales bacterium]|jgi:hypothetical protein|nr:PilZ domain-containing protein [Acidiferrobacterales bacterium]
MTQADKNNPERRERQRKNDGVEVTVAIPGRPPMTLLTSDYSESGIFLLYGARNKPAEGSEITVTLAEFLGSDTPIAMVARIIRVEERGFAIEFVGPAE